MGAVCAWCDAPRQPGPVCPGCGADYAKAEAIRKTGKAALVADSSRETAAPAIPSAFEIAAPAIPVSDPAFERSMCLFALSANGLRPLPICNADRSYRMQERL